MTVLQDYTIRDEEGNAYSIQGEPCLRDEYPELKLFVQYMPCAKKDKGLDCICPVGMIGGCYMYLVSEETTGFAVTGHDYPMPEMAIGETKKFIDKVGVGAVLQRLEERKANHANR